MTGPGRKPWRTWAYLSALTLLAGCQLVFSTHEESASALVDSGAAEAAPIRDARADTRIVDATLDTATDARPVHDATDATDGPGCDPSREADDPHNCGACGHDCQGGGCDGGVCQPFEIAREIHAPGPIAEADAAVYWWSETALDASTSGIIMTAAARPNAGARPFYSGKATTGIQSMLSRGSHLYFTCPRGAYNLYDVSLTGDVDLMSNGGGVDPAGGMAADDGGLYWTSFNYKPVAVSGYVAVWKNPSASDVPLASYLPLAAAYDDPPGQLPVAISPNFVYYASGFNRFGPAIPATMFSQSVLVVAKTGCAQGAQCSETFSTLDASMPMEVAGLVTDDRYVYWLALSYPKELSGFVQRRLMMEQGDAAIEPVAAIPTVPIALAVDENYIYWLEVDNPMAPYGGSLYFSPKDGTGTHLPLMSFQGYPGGLVVGPHAIFWTVRGSVEAGTDSDGSIWGVAKPLPVSE